MTQLDDRHGNIHLDTRLSHKPRPNPQCDIPGFGVILSGKLQALFLAEKREIILGEKTLWNINTQGFGLRDLVFYNFHHALSFITIPSQGCGKCQK